MGASVAAGWAAQDWSAPPLAIGKQGQDVKGLVLISPQWSYLGLSFQTPLSSVALKRGAAWMLIYGGDDTRAKADALRIYKQLEKSHPLAAANNAGPTGLVLLDVPSKLQNDSLLTQVGEGIEQKIVDFLMANVASRHQQWLGRRDKIPLAQAIGPAQGEAIGRAVSPRGQMAQPAPESCRCGSDS
jgi:hypothetical protein